MQFNSTRDRRHDSRILWRSSFEDLGHSRKTADNVRGASHILWLPGNHLALIDLLAFLDLDTTLRGEVMEVKNVPVFVFDKDLWVHFASVLDDDHLVLFGTLGGLLADRLADLDVLKSNNACFFGQNRSQVGVPLDEYLSLGDGLPIGNMNDATVRNLVLLEFASAIIKHGHFALSLQSNKLLRAFDVNEDFAALAELRGAGVACAITRFGEAARCNAPVWNVRMVSWVPGSPMD